MAIFPFICMYINLYKDKCVYIYLYEDICKYFQHIDICWYMCASLIRSFLLPPRLSMLEVPSAWGVVVQGLRSNLFGLACPFCCTPSVGTVLAAFLAGLLCGFGLLAWFVFRFDLFPVAPAASSRSPSADPVSPAVVASRGWLPACPAATTKALRSSLRSVACEPAFVVLLIDRVAELVGCVSGFCPSRARSPSASVGSCLTPPKLRHLPLGLDLDLRPRTRLHLLSVSVLLGFCPGVISPFWCHLVWPWPFFSCLDCWLLG